MCLCISCERCGDQFVVAGVEVASGEGDWIQMMCPSAHTVEVRSMPSSYLTKHTKSKNNGETLHTHQTVKEEQTGTCEIRQFKRLYQKKKRLFMVKGICLPANDVGA